MRPHLILVFDAPLMSFGSEMVDAHGVVRDFPARSMIAGLIANALGWDRADGHRLERLQTRLRVGAARPREGRRLRDFQTAQLGAADGGWTTLGVVEKRRGGQDTYKAPHIRYRDFDADGVVLVAIRLDPAEEPPDLETVGAALDRPERPLFLGRKPFLPSRSVREGVVEAVDIRGALAAALDAGKTLPRDTRGFARAQWPFGEGDGGPQDREVTLTEDRNWPGGVHAGLSRVWQGRIVAAS